MPDPTRLLRTLHQAAAAFRATPGRTGRLVPLDADEVFATSDLHGNVENFRALFQRADLGKHPRRHLVLQELIHGPYRYHDGSDKSHQLLDLLGALKCQFPRQVHMLLGNHELSQWTGREIGKGDESLNDLFLQGVNTAYGEHAEAIYTAYCELFAVVPLALRTANRVLLSHSLPSAAKLPAFDPEALTRDTVEEADLLPGGSVHSLVWGRDVSSPTATAFLEKMDADLLITGHIPCDRGFDIPNDRQIILDSLGMNAAYCLFPTDRPLTHADLVACITTL